MTASKNAFFFLVICLICISSHSCGRGEKIAELGATIDSVQQQINRDGDTIFQNNETIATLENNKKTEYTKINGYDDSGDSLIQGNLIAAAYIWNFYRQDTFAILKKYFELHSIDEVLKLALWHYGLAFYYSQPYGKDAVRILLKNLTRLDSLKNGAVNAIGAIENKVQKMQTANGRLTQEIGGLTARKDELQTTLNALK